MGLEGILEFHPHYDVIALIGVLGIGYQYLIRRVAPRILPSGAQAASPRQTRLFYTALAAIFIVSSWPVHDIGERSLFTFHMIEHLVIALVAAPLLLLGTPTWMAAYLIRKPSHVTLLKAFSLPMAAFFFFNVALAGLHWPAIVELMVTTPYAHFLIHATLFISAIFMWMPIFSPHPAVRRMKPPTAMMYLFAQSLIPTIPASFLVFGRTPMYSFYEQAPKLWGWDPMVDQAIAGIIMKLGGGFLLWGTITVIWFRWCSEERQWDKIERDLRETA